jgi:hypothetical protein
MPVLLEQIADAATLAPATGLSAAAMADADESRPQEHRPGMALRAGIAHRFFGPQSHLLALLSLNTPDLALVTRAAEQADATLQAIRAEVDDQLATRPPALAERAAAAKLANVEQELQAVRQRLETARESYAAAVEGRRDPRQYRPAVTNAETELQDVSAWRGKLADDHGRAAQKVAGVRLQLVRERASAQLAATGEKRTRLKERAESVMRELVGELLLIDAAEKVLAKV